MPFLKGSKRDGPLVSSIHKNSVFLVQVGSIRTRTTTTSYTISDVIPKTTAESTSSSEQPSPPPSPSLSLKKPSSQRELFEQYNNNMYKTDKDITSAGSGCDGAEIHDGRIGAISPKPKSPPPSQREMNRKRVRFLRTPQKLRAARRTSSRPRQGAAKAAAAAAAATPAVPTTAGQTPTTVTRKRKVFSSTSTTQQQQQQQPDPPGIQLSTGISHLSFPMRIRIVIERHAAEQTRKRNNLKTAGTTPSKKRKNNNGCCSVDDFCENDKQRRNRSGNSDGNSYNSNDDIIIGWVSRGEAFKIYDEDRFVREIMPSYFARCGGGDCKSRDQISFEDFRKDLWLWDFTDMPCVEGPTTRITHVCSHPSFARDDPNASSTLRFWKVTE
mmetsp:Transcript_20677/g.48825  ORF Transcript_20677/g.48825 Transcript_20677/m.48825 type:complete len:384 (-) Transcript_20677:54-1205(-)|eukprot:CAMPEP_0197179842 /NCGR_PEP_ID=MMETSP1423-20130617/4657_1 /TAXON_ID=476441 /ORGANISM="Pseudo-nitzschia heimii, Strain UNC1101" /LENGTH=383 /DNA_ID=CAMNT_0042629815 /DNA_START=146 /DNA_END=1297 /DNA_ORIENTATION=+